jgi:hypothetical protein
MSTQPRPALREHSWAGWPLLGALLVPFLGVILGLQLLMRERVGPGLALIFIGVLCWGAWGLGYLAGTGGHSAAPAPPAHVWTGETEEQQSQRALEEAPRCGPDETTPVDGCKE